MKRISLTRVLTAAMVGILAPLVLSLPVAAHDRMELDRAINALFNIEPDFFDEGHELFEREIKHLMQDSLETETSPLLIDDSIQFDPNELEMPAESFPSPVNQPPN